ncbi:MAG: fibronectin type III domain-containing protein [Lachnospiraceae bacterium]|nr:fibronectin type III domain-containing protein [Lachnospiraceae bacterium]
MKLFKKMLSILTAIVMLMMSITGTSVWGASENDVSSKTSIKYGDIVVFGTYEQDNNLSNGSEPIEWRVLDVGTDSVLLMSRYALDCKPYNNDCVNVTWETCTLRMWLNNEFYNKAFTNDDKNLIKKASLVNDDNPEYGTKGGNSTDDTIFLLSYTDLCNPNYGFIDSSFDENKKCVPTAYAVDQGAYLTDEEDFFTSDGERTCLWWLRSPGAEPDDVLFISAGGGLDTYGQWVSIDNYIAVRPALYVKLDSELIQSQFPPKQEADLTALVTGDTKKGDIIILGNYEQDNVSLNGPEPIEWTVLDIDKDKVLLLSKYILDYQPYNLIQEDVTWETCTLRKWLNNEFINTAFTDNEQSIILKTLIKNEDNPYSGTVGGNDTQDKIFVLSQKEAGKYFDNDNSEKGREAQVSEARACKPTEYAKWSDAGVTPYKWYEWADDKYYKKFDGCGSWWLRTPGGCQDNALAVDVYGGGFGSIGELSGDDFTAVMYYGGQNVSDYIIAEGTSYNCAVGVRPALYIKRNFSDNSEEEVTTVIPSKPTIKLKATNYGAKLTINKTKHAAGYEIYVKAPGDKKYSLFMTVSKDGTVKRTIKLKNLQKGKYSIKIRAYSGEAKGKFSKEKSVTIK